MADQRHPPDISTSLQKLLDHHGYSFQQAVKKLALDIDINTPSNEGWRWRFFGSEVPVRSREATTHVDLIFTAWNQRHPEHRGYYLIAECKRANPAKSNWCFVRTDQSWREHDGGFIQFDQVKRFGPQQYVVSTRSRHMGRNVFDLGLEVKTGDKGDSCGASEKSAINQAATQLFRSASGFIDYLCDGVKRHSELLDLDRPELIVPVLFTTARVFSTDTDIGTADLASGLLPDGSVSVEEHDWLWFNVNRSVNLSSTVRFAHTDEEEKHMQPQFREFTRTIAVVSSSGIERFLKTNLNDYFFR